MHAVRGRALARRVPTPRARHPAVAALARAEGFARLVSHGGCRRSGLIPGVEIIAAPSLTALVNHLAGVVSSRGAGRKSGELRAAFATDFAEVRDRSMSSAPWRWRRLEAQRVDDRAAGRGKTLLARALPSILPTITLDEALDVTRCTRRRPAAGRRPLLQSRPFRSPHHTISHAGLVAAGTGRAPARFARHRGVLFLDELPEFGMHVLEVLRQPLEDKVVTISRAKGSLSFRPTSCCRCDEPCPADTSRPGQGVQLFAGSVTRYQKRISAPCSIGSTSMRCAARRVRQALLGSPGEESTAIRRRVEAARGCSVSASPRRPDEQCRHGRDVRLHCALDEAGRD